MALVNIAPDPWEAIEYDASYPADEEFACFGQGQPPLDFYRAAHWLLAELPRAAENMPCFCDVERGVDSFGKAVERISFSTGGWSGAESLLGLIERRFDMQHFMYSWRRGGHYVFEVPLNYLKFASMDEARAAQGTEARRAETGNAD